MSIRIIAATALPLLLAAPAFADCRQELQKLEQATVSAETGASTNKAGVPATKHQEEAMRGTQKGVSQETTGSTGGQVKAVSPHQEQVMGERTAQSGERASQLMTEARKMADAGDEQGCAGKLAEIKNLLGQK
jgi:hypothetical protein